MPAHLLNVEGDIPILVHCEDETPFAILSHRWIWIKGKEKEIHEILYEDIAGGLMIDPCSKQAGYDKLMGACGQAKLDGHTHLWIDSCCIDKRNVAEMSEAINSMYRYVILCSYCFKARFTGD